MAQARGADQLGQGLQQLSTGLETAAVPLAEQAGRDAAAGAVVSKDANGNPIVTPPSGTFLMGQAGEAYAHAAAVGSLARGQMATSTAMNNIRLQHLNDPAGFQTASDGYIADIKGLYGDTALGQTLVSNALDQATQHYIGLTNDAAALGVANAKQSVQTQISDQTDTLHALARQDGGTSTPEFQQGMGKLHAMYDALANPAFRVPQTVIDSEKAHAASLFTADAIVGEVDRAFNRQGRAGAQQYLQDRVLNNPDLHLSDPERNNLYHTGLSRLDVLTGDARGQIAATRAAVEDAASKQASGSVLPASMIDGLEQAAQASGDGATMLRVQAIRANSTINTAGAGLTPQQTLDQHGVGPAPGASGYGATNAPYTRPLNQPGEGYAVAPQQMFSYLKGQGANDNEALMLTSAAGSESSFNPNAIHDGGRGFGLFGHNLQRLDLRQSNWQQQAGAALQELRSRPESALVDAAKTPDDLAVAEMHYERPRGYTDANPRGGDNFTGRMNTIRYFSQMAGGGQPSASPGVPTAPGTIPFSPEQIAQNPLLASQWLAIQAHDQSTRETFAEKLGTSIDKGLDLGVTPSDDSMTSYLQIAGMNPAKFGPQYQSIRSKIVGQQAADQAEGMPGGGGQAFIDAMHQRAVSTGDVLTAATADQAQKSYSRGVTALREDPVAEAVRLKWAAPPPDLNPNDPSTFGAAIAARGVIAQQIAGRTGDPSQSMLGKADVPAIKALLAQGTTDQKLAMLDGWSKVPQPIQQATFAQVGLNDSDAQTFAAAGNVYGHDPQVARDILDGHTLLKKDARLGPKTADRDAALSASMPATDFGPGLTSTVMNAAQALYAKSSALAGDTSQVLSQSRWDDAVNKVTGGVVDWRGSKVIVPAPGMTDGQFRDLMKGLTPADLAGSRTADGTPLPPSALQPTFFGNSAGYCLQSFGDGRYLVFSGDNAARSYLRTDRLDARDPGGPFVLDLRDRAKAVMAGS